jgi:hypothetical protein
MITVSKKNSNVTFIPARSMGGRGDVSGDLFFIEGETIYGWFEADHTEEVWEPIPAHAPTDTLVFPPMQRDAPEAAQAAAGR